MPQSLKDLTPTYLIAIVGTVVGLLATQGLIDNLTEKRVAGLATVLISGGFILVRAVLAELKHASAVTAVAAITSVVALVVTDKLIDATTGKTITGIAAAVIPFLFVVGVAIQSYLDPKTPTTDQKRA